VIRALNRWLAKRRLARICRENMARIHSGPARDRLGRFIRKENHA